MNCAQIINAYIEDEVKRVSEAQAQRMVRASIVAEIMRLDEEYRRRLPPVACERCGEDVIMRLDGNGDAQCGMCGKVQGAASAIVRDRLETGRRIAARMGALRADLQAIDAGVPVGGA